MKRYTTLLAAVVFGGLVMQTGLVSAKSGGSNGNNSNRNRSGNSSNNSQSSQQNVKVAKVNKSAKNLGQNGSPSISDKMWRPAASVNGQGTRRPNLVQSKVEAWKHIGDSFGIGNGKSKHDKKKDQANLGPGRPDGRVETPDVVTMPPSRPGYVWKNGHWERAKAVNTSEATLLLTTPPSRPGYVWNNGQWERAKSVGTSVSTQGRPLNTAVEIRDHRTVVTPPPARSSGRGSYAPYGRYGVTPPPVDKAGNTVKVTVTPGSQRDRTIYGTGPGLHSLWDIIHPTFPELTLEESRDHRTPSKKTK